MPKYAVTFGQKYHREPHGTLPRVNPNGFVLVNAPSYEEARRKVVDRIGLEWAFMYAYNTESERAKVDEYQPDGAFEEWI